MRYDTLAFDTGGTVLDWHGSLVDELARVPAWQGAPVDRHEFANAWRRSTMQGIVGQARPAFNMDDVHLATAARWLNLAPERILMVACHNFDLNAAHDAGLRTAFVARPDEWGPAGPPDPHPNMAYDHIVDGFAALCDEVLSTH